MENQLHPAGGLAGKPRQKNARRRAGLPAKRFFRRFARLSDVPQEDLEFLSQRLREALDIDPASSVPTLQALVHQEIRRRGDPGNA
ncbi:hypothetical protein LFT44_01950 [Arthrobacter sp. FW306-05-C]|uniref:hypothetical protein n=1 Tax=unclassified Arthrobacter TaxID=235627 RepID=UPI001EF0F24D|nr:MULTISPECIES: hypothetical protein [unclassified Arthrobacter]UKA67228.1 hypothetical protein LFT44_01950 [Arthrobacter sp. FW306-05-C]UKA75861.1 hypothetical protein LFT46_01935 [Arthrobacter sp. FW306-07-I]